MENVGDIRLVLRITTPSKAILPSHVESDQNVKNIRFVPNELGLHRISVMFSGRDIAGSPINIVSSDSNAQNNTQIEDHISASKEIMQIEGLGPDGTLESNDVGVIESGVDDRAPSEDIEKHDMDIQNNNDVYIPCPFVLDETDDSGADMVKVTGPGITNGIIGRFESMFTCDTKYAGSGDLSVRIRGPKGMASSISTS
jgi:hypothetical protein